MLLKDDLIMRIRPFIVCERLAKRHLAIITALQIELTEVLPLASSQTFILVFGIVIEF